MPSVGLVCGPTGGHLLPAYLVGKSLQEQSAEVTLYSTSRDAFEWFDPEGLPFVELSVDPWSGQSLPRKIKSLLSILRQSITLRKRVREHDVLISFGGYPAVPGLLCAWSAGLRVYFQEQNRVPGRTHRLFRWLPERTFYGFPPGGDGTTDGVDVTGNPVRPPGKRDDPWFERDPLLIVFGGSQGSRDLSEYLRATGEALIDRGWSVYYLTGKFGRDLTEETWAGTESFRQERFDPNLNDVLPGADCVWSRAGAGTLSELIEYGVPGLVFPYPHATDDHQLENARWVSQHGPLRVIEEGTDTGNDRLLEITEKLGSEPGVYSVPWDREELPQDRIARKVLS